METSNSGDTATSASTRPGIENLTKDELITKYKGLLNIAKKAKQAKDELFEENRLLKEALISNETQKDADKKALLTMKETLEQFTVQKLELSTKLDEALRRNRADMDKLAQYEIENESLRRQLNSSTEENETLLGDLDAMENQLKKVNLIGMEQKKHLELLELEVNRLKESESHSASLQQRLNVSIAENKALKEQENVAKKLFDEITQKYQSLKDINAEQKQKFNSLKERFVDIYRKLKKLKECKRILLETQHEYADSVSKWQNEIIQASRQLCQQLHKLKLENDDLKERLSMANLEKGQVNSGVDPNLISLQLQEFHELTATALEEHKQQIILVERLQNENANLKDTDNKSLADESLEILEAQKLDNKRLTQELEDLRTKLQDKEKNLKLLQEENNLMKKENENFINDHEDDLKTIIEKLETEKKTLEYNLEDLKKTMEDHINEKTKLEAAFEVDKKEQIQEYAATIEALTSELEKCRQSHDELLGRYELKEREHTDLLGEMRELNEALKARGDMISRQEEKQKELQLEINHNGSQIQQIEQSLKEKEELIDQKEKELQLINMEVQAAQNKVQELEATCTRSSEHISALSEELVSLKQSGGNFDAQSDVMSTTSIMSRNEELNRLREVDENVDERYNKLRAMAVKMKKKLQEQSANLEQESKAKETLQTELDECKAKIIALEKQLKLNESLAVENKKLKSSRKQANVLNLEIEAAEKSLTEVSSKLQGKINEINELSLALETKEVTIVQLRKEITILEADKKSECEHGKELKSQIDKLQTQIKDAVHGKQCALDNSKDLEHAKEKLQLEIEDLRLQLSQKAREKEIELSDLQTQNMQMKAKILEMENILTTTQNTLKTSERCLEDLRVEYLDYKVKAQAVLRKNQTKDSAHERELEEDLSELRTKIQQSETFSQNLKKKIEENGKEIILLTEDNRSLQQRNKDLLKIIEELKIQNDVMVQEHRSLLQLQQDNLRHQRQQIESLDLSHKEQLETMELSYQKQIGQLKNELTKAMATRQLPIVGAIARIPPNNEQYHKFNDLLLTEREDAEGSEEANVASVSLATLAAKRKISNDSSTRRSIHEFMPLDELLNAPLNVLNSETVLNVSSNTFSTSTLEDNNNINMAAHSSDHVELQAAKERLQIQESRVRHLTALLAENEQDLAKLTQMNDMLKEELRRQERSVEREQHMHNSEYLKNVIIKFLTLNSVDERTRLVPVLNTILKLSRSEVETLNCAAKGQRVSDLNARSWSNFLPSWGGGSNGGGGNN